MQTPRLLVKRDLPHLPTYLSTLPTYLPTTLPSTSDQSANSQILECIGEIPSTQRAEAWGG